MFGRKLKLYLPFLVVIVAQASFVAVAPSNAPGDGGLSSGGGFAAADDFGGGSFDDGSTSGGGFDADGDGVADPTSGGTDTGSGTDGSTAGGSGSGDDGGQVAGGGQGGNGGSTATTAPVSALGGDTSHCVGDNQFDVLLNAPACKPKFPDGADNGGSTYPGVTADKIKVVQWEYVANQASDSILATQGLATTPEDRRNLDAAAKDFIEEFYELYGRELEIVRVETSCPTSPQDIPKCKQEARRIIDMKPFIVVVGNVHYPEIHDEFARAGIISLGGWHWPKSYFEGRRPFRYDLFADGDQSSEIVKEYFCKKLKGKNATHAGQVIHTSIGGRNTPRVVGVLAPERDTDKVVADQIKAKIQGCGGGDVKVVRYSPDINTATRESENYVQQLIASGVTTVVCFCDPVIPVSIFNAMSAARYFPEHLTSGTGLLDYDLLGRLYDQKQWIHAFGPGHLFDPVTFDQQEVSRMWRASGRSGRPCSACNLNWSYYALVAGLIHYAGPNLTPATAEAGVFNAESYGGDRPGSVLVDYGPGDYGAISDAREIYWSSTATSKIDNRPGAYITHSGSTRYEIGEWTNEFTIPAASS